VAFEADPRIAAIARRNLAAAGLTDVTVIAAAASTTEGTVQFNTEGGDSGRMAAGPLAITVPAVRLRDWLDRPIDLLKMDIEGAEVDVLVECADRLDTVKRIVLEYHSFVDRPQHLGTLMGVLEEIGFRLTMKHEYASKHPLVSIDAAIGMDLRLNIYGVR
jgi:FkbM family methyltransferase